MPSLSFDKSKDSIPVAYVKGGDYNKEVLYLNENSTKTSRKPKNEIPAINYINDLNDLNPAQRPKE
jgi:hypothetical protein